MLLVEDNPNDAALVIRELSRSGFEPAHERVEGEAEFQAALRRRPWDIVLSDFSLPEFSGPRAFRMLRDLGLEIPFVLVSGRIGEELAAEAMRLGISDYVLKDNLVRLPLAVSAALEEARLREDRRRISRQLLESEEKFRNLIENWIHSILVHRGGVPLFANEALAVSFGYTSAADILALPTVHPLFAPSSRAVLLDSDPQPVAENRRGAAHTVEGVRRDGSRIWLQSTSWPVQWEGRPAVQSIFVDITQQKRAEEGLRAQQRLIQTVFDSLPLWLTVHDRAGRLLLANRELCEALGKTPAELRGKSMRELELGTPVELDDMETFDQVVMETGVAREDTMVPLTLPGGQVRKLRMIRTPLRDDSAQVLGLVTVTQDITRQASLEEQYLQLQKMESIGRLAGGVAHDFNNILAVILGFTDCLILESQGQPELLKDLDEMRRAGARGAELTQQLLAFSRRQILQLKPLQLNDVVGQLQRFVQRLIGEDILFTIKLAPDLPHVIADEGQIGQVLMNLAVNARDAMPNGGELVIETSRVTLDEHHAVMKVQLEPGEYVRVQVNDTGTGMSEETLGHLFEPFFTTKEKGRGTGLGLATVYGIVKQLGGHIWVQSAINQGTSFQLDLPVARGIAETVIASVENPAPPAAEATILVVEDDSAVRRATCRILRTAGYAVIEAEGGKQALGIVADAACRVDLLLSDVVMPEMPGPVLMKRFLEHRPGTPVILMSGYSEEHLELMRPECGARLIQKPLHREMLLRAVLASLHSSQVQVPHSP